MKYTIYYHCITTGYGWRRDHSTLEEFEDFINEHRNERTTNLEVWDNTLCRRIFYKQGGNSEPVVDMLSNIMRDMRTRTREVRL